jgi:hypothetical protein
MIPKMRLNAISSQISCAGHNVEVAVAFIIRQSLGATDTATRFGKL